jgi:CheY-like chemotaxis protein
MRCLLVDDDPDSRHLVERVLRGLGHRVMAVNSGAAAVAALGDERFDVALVDLEMPGMNGVDTLRVLREQDGQMRLLVVSGRDDRHHVLEALRAGADGYLVKDELADGLGRALQDIAAGKSPLSAGPAAIVVRAVSGRLPPSTRGRRRAARRRAARGASPSRRASPTAAASSSSAR